MSTLQPVSKEMCVAGSFLFGAELYGKRNNFIKSRRAERSPDVSSGCDLRRRGHGIHAAIRRSRGPDPKKKAAAEFDVYVDAIAAWSVEMPTKKNGSGKDEPLGKGSPSEAIKAYFSDRSNSKQWLAVTTINAFRNSLYPKVTFQ
jgi:hypothetical protein